MNRFLLSFFLLLMLSACTTQGKTGTVKLDSPPDGAVIYSSALTIAGTASGVNVGGLIVTVTDAAGVVLTRKEIPERDASFQYELIHGYSGLPTAATVTLTAGDAPTDPPYAVAHITLASLEHRPEGTFFDIFSPENGDEIGGDSIVVAGRASGLSDRTFTVELVGSDGLTIDSVDVVLPLSYVADDLPWIAALSPKGVTGSALIRVKGADGGQLALVAVVLSSAAG